MYSQVWARALATTAKPRIRPSRPTPTGAMAPGRRSIRVLPNDADPTTRPTPGTTGPNLRPTARFDPAARCPGRDDASYRFHLTGPMCPDSRGRRTSGESGMQRIVVLGGGFAGLWSAVGAARALDQRGIGPDQVEVTLVNDTPWHSIRVRNYEADLKGTRVPLADVLDPIGVRWRVAEVADLNVADRTVSCVAAGERFELAYDRLVFALGSRLVRPSIPGLREHAFDVDTHDAALRLGAHLAALARAPR